MYGFVREGDEGPLVGLGRGARGKTVRELSRLWTYLGGGSPMGDGEGQEQGQGEDDGEGEGPSS